MAGWPATTGSNAAPPAASRDANVLAAASIPVSARTVQTGGTPDNRWQYNLNTQVYTKWWAITYAGLWFDGQRTRPVQWMLDDMERTVVDGVPVWKETWSWVYLR